MLRTVAILWPNQMIYDSMITECSLVDPFLCARCTVSPKITETWDCGFQPRSKAKRSHSMHTDSTRRFPTLPCMVFWRG